MKRFIRNSNHNDCNAIVVVPHKNHHRNNTNNNNINHINNNGKKMTDNNSSMSSSNSCCYCSCSSTRKTSNIQRTTTSSIYPQFVLLLLLLCCCCSITSSVSVASENDGDDGAIQAITSNSNNKNDNNNVTASTTTTTTAATTTTTTNNTYNNRIKYITKKKKNNNNNDYNENYDSNNDNRNNRMIPIMNQHQHQLQHQHTVWIEKHFHNVFVIHPSSSSGGTTTTKQKKNMKIEKKKKKKFKISWFSTSSTSSLKNINNNNNNNQNNSPNKYDNNNNNNNPVTTAKRSSNKNDNFNDNNNNNSKQQQQQQQQIIQVHRAIAQNNNNDDQYNNNDDNNNNNVVDDAYYSATDDDDHYDDDKSKQQNAWAADNELCSTFLVSFLEGTTDARDTCEGIMNAYQAADCSSAGSDTDDQDYDDYFSDFTEHQCCQALQQHHSDYCEEDNLLTNFHLFVAATVLLLCEVAKSLVVRYSIHFLPDAAVCILVGTMVATILGVFSKYFDVAKIDNLSFDDELFLSLLLPPIIFEAALSVSKFEFKRRRGAIFMFSVFGTVISTFSTGFMVHYVSKGLQHAQTFPMLDSLVFGALISSIDPVAILSVLSNLNLDQRDTIFILVFGESLLNDGIAITVFQTLVARFDGKTKDNSTSVDEILDAVATFMIAMFGSIVVGLACGCGAWAYFNMLGNLLPPVMEVGSFCLWALIPYYICDGVGWSGIVSIVAVGFFMDIYIAGPKGQQPIHDLEYDRSITTSPRSQQQRQNSNNSSNVLCSMPGGGGEYRGMRDDDENNVSSGVPAIQSVESVQSSRSIGPLPSTERINMSATADRHVRFVAHLTSTLAENAIFAYIGLFLFSHNYDWNPTLVAIAVSSCILSRTLMVVVVSYMMYHIYKCRGVASEGSNSSRTAAAIQNPRTQAVLVLAGLRGAVSLALVENVPIYNNVTGEGCEFKQLMKGMTSACILFTTFVFGGGAYYILPKLGINQDMRYASSPLSSQFSDNKSVHFNEDINNNNKKRITTHPII